MLSLSWQGLASHAVAQAVSTPAILQMYEARWNTIENRMADIFRVGYGKMWLPPPTRAGSSGSNVGYEVFDRFDLGSPGNPTLYGTEAGLKGTIAAGHTAALQMYTDFVPNHNGFRNQNTPGFLAQGGYNGFALTLPNDQFGDFHDREHQRRSRCAQRLAAWPAGYRAGKDATRSSASRCRRATRTTFRPARSTIEPNPNNARFYPDQDLGGQTFNDPTLGAQVTRYNFNATNPHAGDPVMETAMSLLMRNAQWMVEVIGVDGFRVDAAKHMPAGVHLNLDQAAFRANPRLQLDGSIQPVFMYRRGLRLEPQLVQSLIRKDLPNPHAIAPSDTTVAGNRDVAGLPAFFCPPRSTYQSNSQNNWSQVRAASVDTNDRPAGQPVWRPTAARAWRSCRVTTTPRPSWPMSATRTP